MENRKDKGKKIQTSEKKTRDEEPVSQAASSETEPSVSQDKNPSERNGPQKSEAAEPSKMTQEANQKFDFSKTSSSGSEKGNGLFFCSCCFPALLKFIFKILFFSVLVALAVISAFYVSYKYIPHPKIHASLHELLKKLSKRSLIPFTDLNIDFTRDFDFSTHLEFSPMLWVSYPLGNIDDLQRQLHPRLRIDIAEEEHVSFVLVVVSRLRFSIFDNPHLHSSTVGAFIVLAPVTLDGVHAGYALLNLQTTSEVLAQFCDRKMHSLWGCQRSHRQVVAPGKYEPNDFIKMGLLGKDTMTYYNVSAFVNEPIHYRLSSGLKGFEPLSWMFNRTRSQLFGQDLENNLVYRSHLLNLDFDENQTFYAQYEHIIGQYLNTKGIGELEEWYQEPQSIFVVKTKASMTMPEAV